MSLLDSAAPHVVIVFVEETVTDTHGNTIKRPSATGVEVKCIVTPQANRPDRVDSRADTTMKMIARDAPLGPWSRVEWNDRTFSVEDTRFHNVSEQTKHVEAMLREET
jgi:hypothetical protein